MENSINTNNYLKWTSAINASVLVGKYQDVHEESVRVIEMIHLVTSARNYPDS